MVRRVVTGHDAAGKAVFASDEQVEPITVALLPGGEFHRLWGTDAAPTYPDGGAEPAYHGHYPPVGGVRFTMFKVTPGSRELPPDLDLVAARAEMDEKLPGLTAHLEPDNPGMHTTDTLDLAIVLSGEVTLELDYGATTVLRAGDTLVQNGTRHRWLNQGSEPAVVAIFMTGAVRDH